MVAQREHRIDFDAVKDLSVSEFLSRELGVDCRKVGSSLRMSSCPECGESAGDSYKLSIGREDRTWRCWSCGQNGSILDAAMLLWRCEIKEAAQQLLGVREDLKCALPKVDRSKQDAADAAKTAMMRKAFTAIQLACADFKNESIPLDYLMNVRKLPLSIIREAQRRGMLGFLPADSNKAKDVLLSAVGEDLLRQTELWKPDKKLPGIAYRPIVFFLPGMSSAEFRLAIEEVPVGWKKSIRYGTLEYPYWWEGTDAQAMIVEGAIDTLSAVALDFKGHVMGLTGCNSFKTAWFPAAAAKYGLKRYVVALDNDVNKPDNPGQTWAKNIDEIIRNLDIPSCIRTPEKGDINDILKARSATR